MADIGEPQRRHSDVPFRLPLDPPGPAERPEQEPAFPEPTDPVQPLEPLEPLVPA
jgi:hypothetical protein